GREGQSRRRKEEHRTWNSEHRTLERSVGCRVSSVGRLSTSAPRNSTLEPRNVSKADTVRQRGRRKCRAASSERQGRRAARWRPTIVDSFEMIGDGWGEGRHGGV